MNTRIFATCTLVLGFVAAEAAAQCDTTPPCAPTIDTEVFVGSTDMCVSWHNQWTGDDGCNPNPPATRYEIRMSTSPIEDWSTLPIAGNGLVFAGSDQQHNFSAQCNTTYYFALFFFDEADNRSAPTYLSGTTVACGGPLGLCDQEFLSQDLDAPCAPTDPTIEVGSHTAYLEWNNDSSGDNGCEGLPSKWEIRQSTIPITSQTETMLVCKSTVASSSLQGYNLSGLNCNTTYYWVLFFLDEMGNRSTGVYRSATTLSCNQIEVTGNYDYGLPCCP